MADENNESNANGGDANGGTPGAPKSFADILATLPDDVKAAYTEDVKGLKSALEKTRTEAKEAADRLAALEAERATAAEKLLADQGEFKTLAEKRAEELAAANAAREALASETSTTKERADRAEAALQKVLEARMKDIKIPAGVAKLLEGMPIIDRMDWLNENAAELTKTVSLPPSPGNGNGTVDVKTVIAASKRTF
jgi:hypothetical protein